MTAIYLLARLGSDLTQTITSTKSPYCNALHTSDDELIWPEANEWILS